MGAQSINKQNIWSVGLLVTFDLSLDFDRLKEWGKLISRAHKTTKLAKIKSIKNCSIKNCKIPEIESALKLISRCG